MKPIAVGFRALGLGEKRGVKDLRRTVGGQMTTDWRKRIQTDTIVKRWPALPAWRCASVSSAMLGCAQSRAPAQRRARGHDHAALARHRGAGRSRHSCGTWCPHLLADREFRFDCPAAAFGYLESTGCRNSSITRLVKCAVASEFDFPACRTFARYINRG